jgi:hypothetical protein
VKAADGAVTGDIGGYHRVDLGPAVVDGGLHNRSRACFSATATTRQAGQLIKEAGPDNWEAFDLLRLRARCVERDVFSPRPAFAAAALAVQNTASVSWDEV